ncbi:golgin subfamily A member 6-like protein 22 [Syngnathus typhle]|uniref:golgin subfamily A member 6-like protein 22 n=1 Tax=Syngnathus typhle TaxID=161592 RepID=UPI002A6A099F|nr:golgin subfamily A member 6-like protein 22 [Syngnathus typhle]
MSFLEQPWCPTSVQVTVLQARGLRAKGKGGTNDAYALIQMGKDKFQTSVVEKSVAPVWKEEAAFELPQQGTEGERGTLHVHVLHRALVGPDKLLGQAVIDLGLLAQDKSRNKTEWFKLLDKSGKSDKDRGEVLVDIQFMRNNMTASMFDLTAVGKPRSRLGKLKDKVRGKKKEPDAVALSFRQVLTDSEEDEEESVAGGAAAGEEKKKKAKLKSLFSHKSNLQKNMSQSMSVLPAKNSSLSGSLSSGLNVDASEGKKKFKFMKHKRSGSSDNKEASQKRAAVEKSNLCINGSHVYCEEPLPRTTRIGSNFSLTSSGHGSMEDVPESSPPPVESLPVIRQYTPWEEEEEEEMRNEEVDNKEEMKRGKEHAEKEKEQERRRREEEERERDEEKARKEQEEEARRQEMEKRRQDEEKERKREEEERMRREELERLEEERMRREEEERVIGEELERLEEEKRRREEEERMRQEELERLEEEKMRREEEERMRREELERLEEEKMRREEEERMRKEELERLEAEKMRREEEETLRRQELEKLEEEKLRREEEERKREEEEEEERVRREEEQERLEEEKRREEEEERLRRQELERLEEKLRWEEEERKREEEERIRREEEQERLTEQKRQEEGKLRRQELERLEEEKLKWEKEQRKRDEEKAREEEERMRRQEEQERLAEEHQRLEEERRRNEEKARKEKEERIRLEEEALQEKIRKEDEERARRREEQEEQRRLEERRKEEKAREEEEEERVRRQREEQERLEEEERAKEEERRREEDEKMMEEEAREAKRKEEEQKRKLAEEEERQRVEDARREEEQKKLEEEEKKKRAEEEKEEQERRWKDEEEEKRRDDAKRDVDNPQVDSSNPFEEEVSNHPFEDNNAPSRSDPTVVTQSLQEPETSTTVAQREKRPAPQPPGKTVTSLITEQVKDKEVKTASVPPQRSVKTIPPRSRSPTDAQKHKRPAPSIPSTESKPEANSLNPFDDDDDDGIECAAQDHVSSSVSWPPPVTQTPDPDAKVKSSKVARAPAPPAKTVAVSSTQSNTRTLPDDAKTQAQTLAHRESLPKEAKPSTPQHGRDVGEKKEAPPAPSRRLHPVKPLSAQEQHPVVSEVQGDKKKMVGNVGQVEENTKVKVGPYSMLTREELISLVVKQETQLQNKDRKIAELERYIDNLLVRVMEEQPSILLSMKKVV